MRFAIATSMLLASACLEPAVEIPLGTFDGGHSGGSAGGGSAGGTAGGASAGGAGGGSAGGLEAWPIDGGFNVPMLPMPAASVCVSPSLPPAGCNGEVCLVQYQYQQTPQLLLNPVSQQLGYTLHYLVKVTDTVTLFTTYNSVSMAAGPRRLMAIPASGVGPVVLDEFSGTAWSTNVVAAAVAGNDVFWIYFEQSSQSSPGVYVLKRKSLVTAGPPIADVVAGPLVLPKLGAPLDLDLANNVAYYQTDVSGLYRVGLVGPTTATAISGVAAPANLSAWTRVGNQLYVAECDQGHCRVYQLQVSGGMPVPVAWPQAEAFSRIHDLVSDGARLWATDGVSIAETWFDGSHQGLRYVTQTFPQWGGHLRPHTLAYENDKLYFGQICYPDADAPRYGTVELNLQGPSARWLIGTPENPFVPHYVPAEPYGVSLGQNTRGLVVLGAQ
ncbi:MAG: hypothetical protein IPJ65_30460 [Archangiaceae bacterium]|nr:hypothetical protein [Archangiaceae bacterium]